MRCKEKRKNNSWNFMRRLGFGGTHDASQNLNSVSIHKTKPDAVISGIYFPTCNFVHFGPMDKGDIVSTIISSNIGRKVLLTGY